ncbi:hypothetical protein MTO96_013678 [Rhipicephalus appendiculatus]
MVSLAALFGRLQRKRVALRVASLEADMMQVLHVGGFSVPAPATFHRSSSCAIAKAWKVEGGPSSLPAALWAAMRCLLWERIAGSSPMTSIGRVVEGCGFASSSINTSVNCADLSVVYYGSVEKCAWHFIGAFS